MTTYLCPPFRDAGPNVQTPSAGMDHWAMVDENPHDSDTTFLRIDNQGQEAFDIDFSAVPAGSIVTSVTVRFTMKETVDVSLCQAGIRVGGVAHYGPQRDFTGGTAYGTVDEVFATNPATGAAWTLLTLGPCQLIHEQTSLGGGIPLPRLTQVVLLVDAIPPPDRPSGSGVERVPSATAADLSPSASAATVGPSASGVAVVNAASAAVVLPAASVVVVGGSAGAAARQPGASVALHGKPTADAASRVPTATGVALSRSATAVVVLPKGTPE